MRRAALSILVVILRYVNTKETFDASSHGICIPILDFKSALLVSNSDGILTPMNRMIFFALLTVCKSRTNHCAVVVSPLL